MVCALPGNRQIWGDLEPLLTKTLSALIESSPSVQFLLGTQGDFDALALRVLKKLATRYPHMEYTVVLAYLPTKKDERSALDAAHSVFPSVLDSVPLRFAIDKRNRYMPEQADIVLTYTYYSTGNTAKYKRLAERKGKTVIELFCK